MVPPTEELVDIALCSLQKACLTGHHLMRSEVSEVSAMSQVVHLDSERVS